MSNFLYFWAEKMVSSQKLCQARTFYPLAKQSVPFEDTQKKVISKNKKDCLTIRNILLKSRKNHLGANRTLVLHAL